VSPRAKSGLLFAIKAIVAIALITWLVRSGSLDFKKLGLLFERPHLLALGLGQFFFGVAVNGNRWRVLLRIAGVDISFPKMLLLQMMGLFFAVVIPGNVGGDVIKSLYVARDAEPEKRTSIFLVVFADRFLGLAGLVTIATLICAFRPSIWSDPQLGGPAAVTALLAFGSIAGPVVLLLAMRYGGARLESFVTGSSRLAKLLSQLVAALRLMSAQPARLLYALALTMLTHTTSIGWFTILTRAATGQDASVSSLATIFPLGLLTIVIPISPAGMGVGHVAFDRLFAAIGLTGGATVFNIYLLGQMVPCLFGVIPYLLLKRSGDLPPPETPAPSAPAGNRDGA
jgi:glycosyltransferase 2 family protein